ncbi:MAG TPA: proton-conducting transporter membrane subunit, partial [Hydrogenophilus thermoluteolus]|nr:proton-conducting transporter membrane subunit [Hydrogenophilus thermoluteolus]
MGLLGIVQSDIKRVVAYSTLSQLGYMTVALGASAYSVAIFHLMTHAFFKALLFLSAGSVIIAMHHDQDMRNMGGLWKYLPVTWLTALIGALALIGTPFTSGFYSKDSILIAVAHAQIPGATYAYFCVMAGVFVTAFYTFRMIFLVFHGKERFGQAHAHHDHAAHGSDDHHHGLAPGEKPHESPKVVTVPLVLLAIPSLLIGAFTIDAMLFGGWFANVIFVDEARHGAIAALREEFHGALAMGLHGLTSLPFFIALAGVALAAFFYLVRPDLPDRIAARVRWLYTILVNHYYFDRFNEIVFAGGARRLGRWLWQIGDRTVIDGAMVNGSAQIVGEVAEAGAALQSGRLYHYAFSMILGIAVLLLFLYLV